MTITDVNEQLYQQRRAAIESGRWTRRDDGSYVAWDRAEVLGREGLDMTTGRAALYTSTPAWHGLGTVIPGGISDIDEVLRLGGIDFDVEKRDVRYSFMGDADAVPALRTMPGQYVTVRSDTGAALGVVGSRYEVIQNRELFTFLEDLVDHHGVIWESAGALRDGRRVFVCMRLPENVIIDRGGLADEIVLILSVINSHDGRGTAEAVPSGWRIVCANTERFALRDAVSRWSIRHTSGALGRIEEARRALGLTVEYAHAFEEEETALARTDIALDEFHRVIADLWPVDRDATARTTGMADRRRETLTAMFEGESVRVGRTAYAAERSITDYLDHVAPRRPGKTMTEEIARATALMEGADDAIKTQAHRRLMALVRR
ncbi:hypothetical protein C1I98_13375 [Spongiactinospora gelatinilytica]|uniref:DUF932 domain-containing protein n=1 Tax=Spongiactinospora gelatinilytica TaxID=2666298 RepID=A0A2W2GCN8_9ACTN|nr:DUF932 domain-containing protein [Spongiactinospora gelatinilytica]PZG47456.1 hypothetical protein C1I98_13375 [Spongiactinospora gelatinilytica]